MKYGQIFMENFSKSSGKSVATVLFLALIYALCRAFGFDPFAASENIKTIAVAGIAAFVGAYLGSDSK